MVVSSRRVSSVVVRTLATTTVSSTMYVGDGGSQPSYCKHARVAVTQSNPTGWKWCCFSWNESNLLCVRDPVHRVPRRASLQGISAWQSQVGVSHLRWSARLRPRPSQASGTWVTEVVVPEIENTHASQQHNQTQRDGHGVLFRGIILTWCECMIQCMEYPGCIAVRNQRTVVLSRRVSSVVVITSTRYVGDRGSSPRNCEYACVSGTHSDPTIWTWCSFPWNNPNLLRVRHLVY